MKIVITGAGGMVGRNLLSSATMPDAKILTPTRSELDLRDRAATLAYLGDIRPDLVINAAAKVGGIQANIENPVDFLVDNAYIGLNVITCAHEVGIPRLLNIGSSCMYPKGRDTPLELSELLSSQLEPTNEGYALSKLMAWKLTEYIANTRSDRIYRTIIPCNLYGLHDNFDLGTAHLVPAAIAKVVHARLEGINSVEIWGDGEARREFMFAGDLANFIWKHHHQLELLPQTMNVGVGVDYSVNQYYSLIAELVGYSGTFVHNKDRPPGMKRKLLNVDAQRALGWSPTTDIGSGLRSTIEYYKLLKNAT